MIPSKLRDEDIKFVLVEKNGKRPFEKGWQNKFIKWDNSELEKHLSFKGNYGVMGGGPKNLIIVDFDDEEVQNKVIEKLPKTFTVKTGGGLLHKYFFSNKSESYKIFKEDMGTIADIQGDGKQVVGPGSKHPNGNNYELLDNTDIAFIDYDELKNILMLFDKRKYKTPEEKKSFNNNQRNLYGGDITSDLKSRVKIQSLLSEFGVNTSQNPTSCPFHNSKGGKCLGFQDDYAHCFHCEGKWNIFTLVQQYKNCDFKEALEWLCEREGMLDELKESRRYFVNNENKNNKNMINEENYNFHAFSNETNFMKTVERFYEIQPFYYDKSKIWWLWNFKNYKWDMVDEIDLMNAIDNHTMYPKSSPSIKANLLEAFKRIGRKNKPKNPKKTWIQFYDTIIDIETNDRFNASAEYFITNPIPYKIGLSKNTPIIDELLKQWVGENHIKTMKQIMSYVFLADMPIHRIFCLIGEGLNGKGTFLRLIENFVGEENKCATEIEILVSNRFESSKLYKKLVCITGEIDKGIFTKTKTIKSLSGDDLIRFEFKGKDGFDSHNYAKPLIATNHLPETTDKSSGFYRRWLIVDFPNTFTEQKNVLKEIPKEEYENFCLSSIDILKELLLSGNFENEGNIEDRKSNYEKHAGFIKPFIKDYCDISGDFYNCFDDFCYKFNDYIISEGGKKKSKVEIGRIIRNCGYDIKLKKVATDFGGSTTKNHIFGLKIKYDKGSGLTV